MFKVYKTHRGMDIDCQIRIFQLIWRDREWNEKLNKSNM